MPGIKRRGQDPRQEEKWAGLAKRREAHGSWPSVNWQLMSYREDYRMTTKHSNVEWGSLRMGYKMSQKKQRFLDATVLLATESPYLPLLFFSGNLNLGLDLDHQLCGNPGSWTGPDCSCSRSLASDCPLIWSPCLWPSPGVHFYLICCFYVLIFSCGLVTSQSGLKIKNHFSNSKPPCRSFCQLRTIIIMQVSG